jgi:hypothetical protein
MHIAYLNLGLFLLRLLRLALSFCNGLPTLWVSVHYSRGWVMSRSLHLISQAVGGLLALSIVGTAVAGRPLATDDAATASARTCQIETWIEKQSSDHAWVMSPACGLVDGVELGFEYVHPELPNEARAEAGLALKWAPAFLQNTTAWGQFDFGLKLSAGHIKSLDQGWQQVDHGYLLLASWMPSDAWAVHVNAGRSHDRANNNMVTLLNAATTFAPSASWLVFVEAQTSSKQSVYGKTVVSTGVRYWLRPETLGLDLTASRQPSNATVYSIGVGWYGLFE